MTPRLVTALLLGVWLLPVAASAQTETIEYYVLDALGSVRLIVDQNGQVIERMDYGPFGENLKAAIKMSFEQYAQLARDAETGQDYAEARNYSTLAGRFNRPDPVYAGLFEPQRWNRYAYAVSNPLRFVDTDGLDPQEVTSQLCHNGKKLCVTIEGRTQAEDEAPPKMPGMSVEEISEILNSIGTNLRGLFAEWLPGPLSQSDLERIQNEKISIAGVPGPSAAAAAMARVAALGKLGEQAVRRSHEIGEKARIFVNGRIRIPDGMTPKTLNEVKNVQTLRWTSQLQDYLQHGFDTGRQVVLYVREGATISDRLQRLNDLGLIDIVLLPMGGR